MPVDVDTLRNDVAQFSVLIACNTDDPVWCKLHQDGMDCNDCPMSRIIRQLRKPAPNAQIIFTRKCKIVANDPSIVLYFDKGDIADIYRIGTNGIMCKTSDMAKTEFYVRYNTKYTFWKDYTGD